MIQMFFGHVKSVFILVQFFPFEGEKELVKLQCGHSLYQKDATFTSSIHSISFKFLSFPLLYVLTEDKDFFHPFFPLFLGGRSILNLMVLPSCSF